MAATKNFTVTLTSDMDETRLKVQLTHENVTKKDIINYLIELLAVVKNDEDLDGLNGNSGGYIELVKYL